MIYNLLSSAIEDQQSLTINHNLTLAIHQWCVSTVSTFSFD